MHLQIAKALLSVPFFNRLLQKQARAPTKYNPLGWLVQKAMIDSNTVSSKEMVARLGLESSDKVVAMEWGPGNGISVQALLDTNACEHIYGIELSNHFQSLLEQKFAKEIDEGILSIHGIDAKDLNGVVPQAEGGVVDVAIALNVIYFLDPLADYLKELHRVCKPGARVIFGVSDAAKEHLPDIFVNRDWEVCMAEMEKAGFGDIEITNVEEEESNPLLKTRFLSCRAAKK